MLQVTPDKYAALEAVCDALIPALSDQEGDAAFWASRPSDQHVARELLSVIGTLTPGEQKEFQQLLSILESRITGLLFGGKWAKFRELTPQKQEQVLQKWVGHRLNLLRKAFQTLKKLSMFLHYGNGGEAGHPAWKAMGYEGPMDIPAGAPAALQPESLSRDTALDCDVVVVGSGSGGGVVAGLLAEAGHAVIVVEKGPYLSGEGWTQKESDMVRKAYDQQGALATTDGGVTVFAGSCLGGGSAINWTGSFPTPDYVLGEWAQDHGFTEASSSAYSASLQAAMTGVNANTNNSAHNPQNDALWRGSEALGEQVDIIHRNVDGCQADDCKSCGYCGFGCRRGTKQSTTRTWLQRAFAAGARILVDTTVDRVTHSGSIASGIEAWTTGPDGQRLSVRIRAKRVVVAAGAVQTPALLLRSGLRHPQLGRNLFFHPTVAVAGYYPEVIAPWYGVMMSAVNKAGIRRTENYGYWVETPPLHPGTGALALPWTSGAQHKQDLRRVNHMASFIVLTRDKFGGRVRTDRHGNARVQYSLSAYDRENMLQGMQAAYQLHRAAGAEEVLFPHNSRKVLPTNSGAAATKNYLQGMPGWGWKANQFSLFTAHQMGTCAIGGDARRHPVAPDGAFRGTKGLYIADGSLMPTCAGINPMISIMGLAHWIGKSME